MIKAEIIEDVHYQDKYTLVLIPENKEDYHKLLQLQGEVRAGWTISAEPLYTFDVEKFEFTLTRSNKKTKT